MRKEDSYGCLFDDGSGCIGTIATVNVIPHIRTKFDAIVCAFLRICIHGTASSADHFADCSCADFIHLTGRWFICSRTNKVTKK